MSLEPPRCLSERNHVLVPGTLWLEAPAATIAAGAAIAIIGLPHGAMDLQLLAKAHRRGAAAFSHILALYLGCAAVMAIAWWTAPVAALAIFIVLAVVHFAEDWSACGSAFLQHGMALALLAAPALLHREAVTAIFVALTGAREAAFTADALLLVAPVAFAVGLVAIAAMAVDGAPRAAAAAALSLAALTLLPPAPGFAVYFCVFHSPRHFRAALATLGWSQPRQWLPVVVPITAIALTIAAALFQLVPATGVPARLVAAVFMTLSVLTLPHLAVPLLLRLSPVSLQLRGSATSAGR